MSDNQDSEILEHFASGIHHFHIDHIHLVYPPRFCITIVFDFSWDDYNTQEKLVYVKMANPQSKFPEKEPGIWDPQHGIQNPRLSWIPLHEPGELVTYKLV